MTELDDSFRATALRDAYDAQIRTRVVLRNPRVETIEQIGPIWRKTSSVDRGFITYRDLAGLSGTELDAFLAAQREHFRTVGTSVEWKYHSYDEPDDLPQRLRANGFVPDDPETLVLGEAADLAIPPRLPAEVSLRRVSSRQDLERIQALEETVWGYDHSWLPDALESELDSPTDPIEVVVAEAASELVCAGWIRFHRGTEFAGLWGGSTLESWRGRGVYRATVAHRAQLALAKGFRYLQVDCSPDSGPILRRLGMLAVATTVPYVWRPESQD